jgi:hypothetical protein
MPSFGAADQIGGDLAEVPIGDRKKSDGTPCALTMAVLVEDTWPLGDAVINGGLG